MADDIFNVAGDMISGALSAERSMDTAAAMSHLPPSHGDVRTDTDDRIDKLLLVCTAMWQLLKERTNLTEEDLANRIAILDAADGVADGKLTQAPQPCPKCHRIVAPKHERCMYCGFQLPVDNIFKTL